MRRGGGPVSGVLDGPQKALASSRAPWCLKLHHKSKQLAPGAARLRSADGDTQGAGSGSDW